MLRTLGEFVAIVSIILFVLITTDYFTEKKVKGDYLFPRMETSR